MKKLVVIFSTLLIIIFSFAVNNISTAKYVFDQSIIFDTIIFNITEETNLGEVYKDKEFEIPEGESSSDNVLTLNGGDTNYDGYDTQQRWTNWSSDWDSRTDAATASLVFDWGSAHTLTRVDIYYFMDYSATRIPEYVELQYKNSNGEWIDITSVTETKNFTMAYDQVDTINGNYWDGSYTGVAPCSSFEINDVITDANAIRVILHAQTYNTYYNYCVGLIEVEIFI